MRLGPLIAIVVIAANAQAQDSSERFTLSGGIGLRSGRPTFGIDGGAVLRLAVKHPTTTNVAMRADASAFVFPGWGAIPTCAPPPTGTTASCEGQYLPSMSAASTAGIQLFAPTRTRPYLDVGIGLLFGDGDVTAMVSGGAGITRHVAGRNNMNFELRAYRPTQRQSRPTRWIVGPLIGLTF